jgi:hypothetical protein
MSEHLSPAWRFNDLREPDDSTCYPSSAFFKRQGMHHINADGHCTDCGDDWIHLTWYFARGYLFTEEQRFLEWFNETFAGWWFAGEIQ